MSRSSRSNQQPRNRNPFGTEDRFNLPVYLYKREFLIQLEQNDILIVMGETGSGKTTQFPQFLYEAGYGQNGIIGCTLPRCAQLFAVFMFFFTFGTLT